MSEFRDFHIKRAGLGIGMLSASVIAFQLALMQVFSITQWYHFAHMIISLALLGFGASGTFLFVFRKVLVRRFSLWFSLLLFLTAASMAVVIWLAHTPPIQFDTYLLFTDSRHLVRLTFTCLILLLPFFFAALAIGMSFMHYSGEIGKIYFANLFGSGIGGILALGLMWLTFPSRLPAMIAFLPFLAGCICLSRHRAVVVTAACSFVLLVTMNLIQPELVRSEYKSIQKALLLPEAKVVLKKNSPYGLVELVRAPTLRYAPGLSLSYQDKVPTRDIFFNNGDWLGAVIPKPAKDSVSVLKYSANSLPYIIQQAENVLILNPGAGENIALSQSFEVEQIDAVEPNRVIYSLLKEELADASDSLLFASGIEMYGMEPRTFLSTTTASYDLVQLPMIGSFFGTSGVDAFHTRYELTTEAFREMWEKLGPDGMISIGCWMDYPVRNPLRILVTLSSLLYYEGVREPYNHIAAVRSWSSLCFVVRKSAFTPEESRKIREFCETMYFDPLLLPGVKEFDREAYNQLNDPWFFEAVDEIMSPQAELFYEDYPFRIQPASDNRPYFSQFLRLKTVHRLAKLFGNQSVPYLELGYVVVLLTFGLLLIASLILILLPLWITGYRLPGKAWTLLYFIGIGLGYLFLEMVLIQQFTLFLGHPVYSASGVISILLVASGIGSYWSGRVKPSAKWLFTISISIAGIFLIYALGLAPILRIFMAFPAWTKVLIMAVLVGLPGFLMGFPFPLGLTRLSQTRPDEIPWAWAINGCASVIGTTLAIIISVEGGFVWVMIFAAMAYSMAAAMNVRSSFF